MLSLLQRPEPLPPAEQRRNNAHRAAPVAAALAVLALYAFAFTDMAPLTGLPGPGTLLARAGAETEHLIDGDGNFAPSLWMSEAHEFPSNDREMLAYFSLLAGAFVSVYFLPLRLKRDAITAWTALLVAVGYGPSRLGLLLFAHLGVYLVFHPDRKEGPTPALLAGAAAALALAGRAPAWALFTLLPPALWAADRLLLRRLARLPRAGLLARTLAAQSLLLTTLIAPALNGAGLLGQRAPLGLLLFFGQWMRLMLYQVDYEDGLVPRNLSWRAYLANFLHPAVVANWFAAIVSQGYAYTEGVFLREDKNRLIYSGLRLLLLGLLFMACGDWFSLRLAGLLERAGIAAHRASIPLLTGDFAGGLEETPLSIWATCLLHVLKFTFYWAGVAHFKVGVWRLFGFAVAPHFQNWLAATDFVTFWGRYTYHYREFLLRAFFFPVFFRFPALGARLRSALAVFAAAGLGNMVWGHLVERTLYDGFYHGTLSFMGRRWPYFLLLAALITGTMLYQTARGHPRRRPWTPGPGLAWDAVCACATIGLYCLLHIFAYPSDDATLAQLGRLFLRAFAIG